MVYLRSSCRGVLTLALTFAAACGDNSDAPKPDAPMDPMDDAEFDEDGCRILTLGQKDFSFNLFDQILGVRFPVKQSLGGARGDVLHIELWDSTTPELPPLTTGTFDLSTTTDLAACQHCVWVEVDATNDGFVDSIYLATEGTLAVDKVTDPLEPVFAAHAASRIVLRRATVGDNSHSTFVPDGDCVSISNVSFDTTPTPGASCESAEDCGNPLFEICDPSNNKCAPPECNFDNPCTGNGEVCLIQYRDLFEGACYQTCDPRAATNACGSMQRCVQRGVDPSFGVCKYYGTGELGSTCEVEDNTTSCVGKAECSGLSNRCMATCDFFAEESGCPGATQCSLFNLCEPPSVANPARLGQTCGEFQYEAQGCAADGEAFRGICFAYEDRPQMCERACLGDQGCGSDEFCALRYSSGLGICLPLPVCGDGVRGEINEACDDGNDVDGDGCSDNCQTVDVGPLCSAAPTLALGTSVNGNTATGIDGVQSSCQPPTISRTELHRLALPGPGRLRLHLTSARAQSLSLRSTCTDVDSELGCDGDLFGATDKELVVQIKDATPAPVTVVVSAMTILDESPYTLESEFLAEDCSDGEIAGREVCDDGNTDDNDGCSGDCRTIEYGYYCSQAPTLSTAATNAGDLTGAPAMYPATCSADDGTVIHPSRLYRFQAPAAGTLHLDLDDDTSFAVLSVRDACGTPATTEELHCKQAFNLGEIDVPLTAGQEISIVVSTYFASEGFGTYTLDASFTPQ